MARAQPGLLRPGLRLRALGHRSGSWCCVIVRPSEGNAVPPSLEIRPRDPRSKMPSALEHEHAAHIKAIFSKHDADQSGFIDAAELPQALAELGVDVSDAARVEAMLADVDTDRSGQLDLPEFSQIFATGRLRSVFDEIDLDRSGTISTEELGHALKALGCSVAPSQLAGMLAEVDTDGSGLVSFDEFSTFFALVPFASLDSIAQRWASLDGVMGASDLAPPIPPADVPTWLFLAAGGIGGCVSRTATAPLERVKLAAQIRGNGVKIFGELSAAYAQGGVKALFAGNFANCIRVFPYAGIVALTYNRLIALTPADGEFDSMEPVYRGGCAATAGVIGQITTYPLDVVRARLTIGDGGRQSVLRMVRRIHNTEGIRGLYRGLLPTCMATASFLAIQLPTLDVIKMSANAANVPISNGKLGWCKVGAQ